MDKAQLIYHFKRSLCHLAVMELRGRDFRKHGEPGKEFRNGNLAFGKNRAAGSCNLEVYRG
jgi:hypothetical protein